MIILYYTNKTIEGLIFVGAGFPMLIIGLFSYAQYQYTYDWTKARLDDPTADHTYDCSPSGAGMYLRCPLKLPTLSLLTILQIALGAILVIFGTIRSVVSYSRYEPKASSPDKLES